MTSNNISTIPILVEHGKGKEGFINDEDNQEDLEKLFETIRSNHSLTKDPILEVCLGICHENRMGVAEQSNLEAAKCYLSAAKKNNTTAMVNLANLYEKEADPKLKYQHLNDAIGWYKKAGMNDLAEAARSKIQRIVFNYI